MKRLLSTILFSLLAICSYAAINAQYTFEAGMPDFISVNGDGKLESSTERFKDGSRSVKFTWNGPSELVFSNFSDIKASMAVNGAGLMMWVYNTVPMAEPVRFRISL